MASGRHIYWGSGSFFAWRALITLEEKSLPYENHLISFSNREHKTPEFIAINPRGQVPSFRDGDIVIHESGAICQYLEDAYPDSGVKLMPSDLKLKARVLQILWESNNLYPVARPLMFGDLAGAEREEAKAGLLRELSFWEKYLEGQENYLAGDSFTLADVFVVPAFAALQRFGLDFAKAGLPKLARYVATQLERPSVAKTSPPHWKEGPGNGKLADVLPSA